MDTKVLYQLSYGVYVVSSKKGDKINGQIANTVFQITSEPATMGISINRLNLTHEYISDSGIFTVAIIDKDAPLKFIGNFGFKCGRDINKFENVKYKILDSGCPVPLDNILGYLECKVINKTDVGTTHTIFIGEVTGAETLKQGEVMTYAYYHEVKRGTTPKTAPTYIKPA